MRLELIDEEHLNAEARQHYESDMRRFGQVLPSTQVYALRPELLTAVRALGAALNRGRLPEALRYLVSLRVAQIAGCPF